VDEEVCAAANSTLTARLGKQETPLVRKGDSLKMLSAKEQSSLGLQVDSHRCVATNPPFGTRITVKDPKILTAFELAALGTRASQLDLGFGRVTPRPPDILFLELCVRLLQPGFGRLAIVLPYQILSGPQ